MGSAVEGGDLHRNLLWSGCCHRVATWSCGSVCKIRCQRLEQRMRTLNSGSMGCCVWPDVQPTLRQLVQLLQLSHNFLRRLETLGLGASAGSKKYHSSVYSLHHLQQKRSSSAKHADRQGRVYLDPRSR